MGYWWQDIPWRMIQTNLRQIDMRDMDAKTYAEQLRSFGATVALINAAGIIASYETGLPFHYQSGYLNADSLQQVVEECHRAGIYTLARTDFSKVRRAIYERHPEWAYRTAKGEIVDYNGDVHVCLNSGYQQEGLFQIVEECIRKVGMDGLFCNMTGFQTRDYSYNEYGLCHCENCKRLFFDRFGLRIPQKADMDDPGYRKYLVFQRERVAEHNARLYRLVKSIDPNLAVNGADIVRMESNTEYGRPLPHWQYSGASNTRNIRGDGSRGVVISNTSVDFIGFFYRHVAVSPPMQEQRLWQNLANLGGLDYYLIGRLDNHEDRSGYARVRRVFEFHREHEAVYQGLVSRAEALLLRQGLWSDSKEERGWVRALSESHILFDEAQIDQAADIRLEKYRVVILPNIGCLPEAFAAQLDAFVHDGGIVVSVGESGLRDGDYEPRERPMLDCLGVERICHIARDSRSAMLRLDAQDKAVFRHFPDAELVAIGDTFLFAQLGPKTQGYMRYIPPHWYGPPERCYYTQVTDIPGVTRHPYGQGAGIMIPWLPGGLFYEGGYENTLNFLRGVLLGLCGLHDTAPSLTPMAEVTVAEKPGLTLVSLVNNSGHFGTSFYEALPIRDAQVTLLMPAPPHRVHTLMRTDNVQYAYAQGQLTLTVGQLDAYEAVVIQ